MRFSVLVVVGALGVAVVPAAASAQGFTNVTQESGLEAIRASKTAGYWMSGLLFVDLDGDGDLDFFFGAHHGEGGIAALNDGKGHFTAAPPWSTTTPTEIHIPYDLDEDGKLDLTLTEGDGGGRWWMNGSTPGMLSFRRSALSDLQARVQMMVDINRDGRVDWIAIGSGSGSSAGPGARAYYGDGKGGFAATPVMLAGTTSFTAFVDIDGDGDKDALRGRGNYPNSPPEPVETLLYRNDGAGAFTDITAQAGLAVPGLYIHGQGDVDQDGDTDLMGLEANGTFPMVVYLNDGRGVFTKKPDAVDGPRGRAAGANPGLATVADLDNDGVADVLIGGVSFMHVLRGRGGGAFTYVNQTWGGITSAGELPDASFTFGDMDGDGDLDLANYRSTYPNKLLNVYRNDLPRRNWVRVRVAGMPGNRGALGSYIRVYEAGTDKLLWFEEVTSIARQVQQNYYAAVETERHFGLGDRAAVDVTVQFYPSNKLVKKTGVAANTTVRIGEDGMGTIVVPPREPPLPPNPSAGGDGGAREPLRDGGADGGLAATGRADAGPATGPGGNGGAGGSGGATGGPSSGAGSSRGSGGENGGASANPDEPGGDAAAGCACRTTPARAGAWTWLVLLAFAVAATRSRRSRS